MCENRRKLVVWSFWLRKQALIRQNGRKMEEKRRKRENSTTSSLDKVVEMALGKICWCGVARSGSQARGQHLSFRRVCCLTAECVVMSHASGRGSKWTEQLCRGPHDGRRYCFRHQALLEIEVGALVSLIVR